MKATLYLETTIPSYLVARPSRDLVAAARQELTRQWWSRRKDDFRVYLSQVVIDEMGEGDKEAAKRRLDAVSSLPLLAIDGDVIALTEEILKSKVLPRKAARDAAHIAVSAVHNMDFLLTWNCVHLANAEIYEEVRTVCMVAGWKCPVICTPEELL